MQFQVLVECADEINASISIDALLVQSILRAGLSSLFCIIKRVMRSAPSGIRRYRQVIIYRSLAPYGGLKTKVEDKPV